jgi:hypothetical protein
MVCFDGTIGACIEGATHCGDAGPHIAGIGVEQGSGAHAFRLPQKRLCLPPKRPPWQHFWGGGHGAGGQGSHCGVAHGSHADWLLQPPPQCKPAWALVASISEPATPAANNIPRCRRITQSPAKGNIVVELCKSLAILQPRGMSRRGTSGK